MGINIQEIIHSDLKACLLFSKQIGGGKGGRKDMVLTDNMNVVHLLSMMLRLSWQITSCDPLYDEGKKYLPWLWVCTFITT